MHLDFIGRFIGDARRGIVSLCILILLSILLLTVLFSGNLCQHVWKRFISFKRVYNQKVIGLWYLFDGARTIDRGFLKANGQPFIIHTPTKDHVMITSPQHIKELGEASSVDLSLHAAAKEILQPKYTMEGFIWKDVRNEEGLGFVKAVRTVLTSHLPSLLPSIRLLVQKQISDSLSQSSMVDGYYDIPLYAVILELVTTSNTYVCLGEELSRNEVFLDAARSFPTDVFIAAEIIQALPSYLNEFIAKMYTRNYKASKTIFNALYPIVEQRIADRAQGPSMRDPNKPTDGIQWLVDTSPRDNSWSVTRTTHEIMAVWFGTAHTLASALTHAITDLCLHPEYREPLLDEINSEASQLFAQKADGLPLQDSFLKESLRLNFVHAVAGRRKALRPFTFSDGLHVSQGDWVAIPFISMMKYGGMYSDPDTFDGFRYVERDPRNNIPSTIKDQKATDPNGKWMVWGVGRILCAGRFYASVVCKLALSDLLKNYDFHLPDNKPPKTQDWRSFRFAHNSTRLRLKPKASGKKETT